MLFSDLTFIFLFLPLFFLSIFIFRNDLKKSNYSLLVFSLFFYAWGEIVYVFLLMIGIVLNYYFAIWIDKARRADNKKMMKLGLWVALLFNLGSIGYFKYTGFFIEIINSVTGLAIPIPEIALPIGISFFTFQIFSYVIDVYRNEVPVQKNVLYLGAYVMAFPQLIAGPIVRYQTVAEEMECRRASDEDIAYGIRRFMAGLAKKVLIANQTAFIADTILAGDVTSVGAGGAWLAMIAYSLQIYFDFSGYSDMAIGLGRMMGFHFLENFNNPYSAVSITDFWRRWHISLSSFFRDYVYIPLGGNRVSKPRWIFNMAAVWALTGLWHGASLNFVLWGAFYGLILILEKLVFPNLKDVKIFNRIFTLFVVIIGWTIFRCEDFGLMKDVFATMFGANGGGNLEALYWLGVIRIPNLLAVVVGIIFSSETVCKAAASLTVGSKAKRIIADVCIFALLFLCIANLAENSYNPFIYFRF